MRQALLVVLLMLPVSGWAEGWPSLASPPPRQGGLQVTGSPKGALVKVEGPDGFSNEGGLPWEASGLKSGEYRVKVVRDGYESLEQMVTVEAGNSAPLPVKLEKKTNARAESKGRGRCSGTIAPPLGYLTEVAFVPTATTNFREEASAKAVERLLERLCEADCQDLRPDLAVYEVVVDGDVACAMAVVDERAFRQWWRRARAPRPAGAQ